eukprot:8160356-Pyramimonas_sp.AAC.1
MLIHRGIHTSGRGIHTSGRGVHHSPASVTVTPPSNYADYAPLEVYRPRFVQTARRRKRDLQQPR